MLKNRNFITLWLATWISAAGDTFNFLALAIRIDDLFPEAGDSARSLGLVMMASVVPVLLIGMFAGTMVDRWDRKKVMIGSDLLRAILVPGYLLLGTPEQLPIALVVAFLLAAVSAFFYPARTALLPALVDEQDLMSANGWMQMGQTVARLTGPILAGLVVAAFGTSLAFVVDSISFLVSGGLLLMIAGVPTVARLESTAKSAWKDFLEGARYAFKSSLLRAITLGISVVMLGLGAVNVLFVPFLRNTFNVEPTALGVVETAQGVGMLAGGLAIGALGKKLSSTRIAFISIVLLGVGICVFGMAPTYAIILVIMPIIGLTLPPVNASLNTLMQTNVPSQMLGRSGAVIDMSSTVANLISMGLAGVLADAIGFRETFILGGIMIALGGLMMGWLLQLSVRSIGYETKRSPELMAPAAD
ncbi:MAG: MFS transporter [Anaerolineales bacterium]|jgi:MFS family permease